MSALNILRETLRPSSKDMKRTAIKSAGWSGLSMGAKILLTLCSVPILARLISPEHYGVVGLATLVVEMIALLGEVGFHSALIQQKRVYRLDLDTAFWTNIAVGIGLAAMVFLFSPLAVWFFQEPRLTQILAVSALALVISNASALHHTILVRTMHFREIAVIEFCSTILRIGSAIAFAWAGMGYWALVLSALVGFTVTAAMRLVYVSWLPQLRFSSSRFRSLWRYGKNILLDNMVTYFANNVDYLIVGRRLGPQMLGYYQMAFTLPDIVRKNLTQILSRVLFPAYSRVQNEDERLFRGVRMVNEIIAVVALPALGGLIVVAPILVPLYFGSTWLAIIIPLQLLCVSGMARTLGIAFGPVLHAKGRSDISAQLSLARVPFVAIAVWSGSHWGITGAAAGFAMFSFIWFFVSIQIVTRLIGYSTSAFFIGLLPAVSSTLLMMASVHLVLAPLNDLQLSLWSQLFLSVVTGIATYLMGMALFGRKQLVSIMATLFQLKGNKDGA